MKTFDVIKILRDANGQPASTEKPGTVTAYTYKEAMSKAAYMYNNGNWANISVYPRKTKTNRTNKNNL